MTKTGGWGSLVPIYLYGVASAASLSKAIPLQQHIAALPGAGGDSFALYMALMAVLPAVFGAAGGGLIDRIGARPALLFAALCGTVLNAAYALTDSIGAFLALRVVEGLIPLAAYAAAPALMIATAAPERRNAAMALWSTYTPVGTSLGLLIAAGFAAGSHWQRAYVVHGAIFAGLAVLAVLLPRTAAAGSRQRASVLALLTSREGVRPLRLALAFGLLILLGLGVSVVFPPWLSRQYGVGVSTASRILAAANLVMILGSTASGLLLSRRTRPTLLFAVLAVCGCIAGIGIFMPQPGLAAAIAALVAWSLCTGAAMAVLAAQLPHVVEPGYRAAAAGLLSQTGALLTFVTPSVWLSALSTGRWSALAVIVVAGWFATALLLPARGTGPAAAAH